jgi:hypothetical protein
MTVNANSRLAGSAGDPPDARGALDSLMWIPIALFEVIFAFWLFFREPQIQE